MTNDFRSEQREAFAADDVVIPIGIFQDIQLPSRHNERHRTLLHYSVTEIDSVLMLFASRTT
jgi:hypothetical protein